MVIGIVCKTEGDTILGVLALSKLIITMQYVVYLQDIFSK